MSRTSVRKYTVTVAFHDTRFLMIARLLLTLLMAGSLIGFAAPAFAQAASKAECPSYVPAEERSNPNQLALRGVACFEAKNYLQALIFYREAYGISKSALLRGAIGRSLQELGFPDLAREYYKSYLRVQAPGSDGYQKIRERMDVVEQQLAERSSEVEIRSTPSDAKVYVILDGEYWEELGTTPLKVRLLPGDYKLVFRKADHVTEETEITVEPKTDAKFEEELIDQTALFGTTNRRWRQAGVITMLSAIPFAAGSVTMLILSANERDKAERYKPGDPNYDPAVTRDSNKQADLYHTIGVISGSVAAGAAVTGLIFYLIGLETADETPPPAAYVTPNEAGVILYW